MTTYEEVVTLTTANSAPSYRDISIHCWPKGIVLTLSPIRITMLHNALEQSLTFFFPTHTIMGLRYIQETLHIYSNKQTNGHCMDTPIRIGSRKAFDFLMNKAFFCEHTKQVDTTPISLPDSEHILRIRCDGFLLENSLEAMFYNAINVHSIQNNAFVFCNDYPSVSPLLHTRVSLSPKIWNTLLRYTFHYGHIQGRCILRTDPTKASDGSEDPIQETV